jgi:hypothetical protein
MNHSFHSAAASFPIRSCVFTHLRTLRAASHAVAHTYENTGGEVPPSDFRISKPFGFSAKVREQARKAGGKLRFEQLRRHVALRRNR